MESLIEVVGIREENCTNCHQCIVVCPVKICSDGSGDVVKFNNHLCIGCGRCIEACIKSHGGVAEKSARFAIDDSPDFCRDLGSKDIVALVAPSAQSNFNVPQLITALKTLGIKAVYDVALGAEITVAAYHEAIKLEKVKLPVIAQPCPAVVNYIELHHPSLIEHLAPVGSPVHNLAVYVRTLYPDAELAFISPCLAKRREFRDSGMVKYNVTFQSLLKILHDRDIQLERLEGGRFDNGVEAGMATMFPTPGGLKESYLHHYPHTPASAITKVEGPIIFDRYLKDLANSIRQKDPHLPLLVDILNCEKGCNMGIGCINQHKSLDEIESSIAMRAESQVGKSGDGEQLKTFLALIMNEEDFAYRKYRDLSAYTRLKKPNAAELQAIYIDMHKSTEKDFRNCAACGYNSCFHMAIAVFNGLNKVENCHLYQEKELRREHKALNSMVDELEALNIQLQEEMTERKNQEQMLIQNSKLAAMGEMIGMIAHQWRQPLSSISTIAGNLKVFIDLDMYEQEQFLALLDEINGHVQYLSNTINDFRHFFKPDNPRDTVMIDQIIESTLGIIGKSLEYKSIALIKNFSFSRPIITYPNELMQVFLNIIKNASDAIIDNEIKEPMIFINGYEDGEYQIVKFEDNAGGVPEAIMDKIFDPYFSTKGPGIGTGLGLYMSKIIVEEHCHGQLGVQNTARGACFTIKLPADREDKQHGQSS